jgi:hypothetical protein
MGTSFASSSRRYLVLHLMVSYITARKGKGESVHSTHACPMKVQAWLVHGLFGESLALAMALTVEQGANRDKD